MNAIERLREYAEATRWGGECEVLHRFYGERWGDCEGRSCGNCRAAFLASIAVEMERESERIKRTRNQQPVLDADGVEIKVGDTVYVMGFDEPLTVKGFTDDGRVLMSFHDENSLGYKPSQLTHERPVLDADGVLIKVGETVWEACSGHEIEVIDIRPIDRLILGRCTDFEDVTARLMAAENLTHKQPDSWQRIEDDAKKNACEVFHPGEEECEGCRFEGEGNCEEELRLELVKRCKELAERS